MKRVRLGQFVAVGAALVAAAIVLWIDIASGIWQEFVILSGVAAGLVTFLLTVLVLDRVIARSTARRWAPVSRLALSEFLHALADDEHSEISRGHIVTRALPTFDPADPADPAFGGRLHELRELVVTERALLADVVSRWAQFLASSGDNEGVLVHIADLALRLDDVRDAALDAEANTERASLDTLRREIEGYNENVRTLVDELRARLATAPQVGR